MNFAGIERDSTREDVLKILTRNFPLPLKKIHSALRTEQKRSLTLQATHKALRSLMDEGIVLHDEDGYRISLSWALSQKEMTDKFIDLLDRSKGSAAMKSALDQNKRHITRYSNLAIGEPHWIRLLLQATELEKTNGAKDFLNIGHIPYWLFINLGASVSFFQELKRMKLNVHHVFLQKGFLTDWSINLYRGIGAKACLATSDILPQEIYCSVINDCVVQGSISKKAASELNAILKTYQTVSEIPPKRLEKVFHNSGELTISVENNPVFAHALRREFLKAKLAS